MCTECNDLVNREVETPARDALNACKIVFDTKGRRKRKGFTAVAKFGNEERPVRVDNRGKPKNPVQWCERDKDGKKTYGIAGPHDLAEAERRRLSEEKPHIRWTSEHIPEAEVIVEGNFWSLKRLAAKVALEWWAFKRASQQFFDDPQYDNIRRYILMGDEDKLCCGFFPGPGKLRTFCDFKISYNVVVVVAHPDTKLLTGIVSFYGLFYLWVLLSTEFTAVTAFDYILFEHPGTGEAKIDPRLRTTSEVIPIGLPMLIEKYQKNENAYALKAKEYAEKTIAEYQKTAGDDT